jgi:hypothetical protein
MYLLIGIIVFCCFLFARIKLLERRIAKLEFAAVAATEAANLHAGGR